MLSAAAKHVATIRRFNFIGIGLVVGIYDGEAASPKVSENILQTLGTLGCVQIIQTDSIRLVTSSGHSLGTVPFYQAARFLSRAFW